MARRTSSRLVWGVVFALVMLWIVIALVGGVAAASVIVGLLVASGLWYRMMQRM